MFRKISILIITSAFLTATFARTDTSLVIKTDTIVTKTVVYDTFKVIRTIKDSAIVIKTDTIKSIVPAKSVSKAKK